ncbi:MAG TPA: N-acetylmuramoyl-L-alanine amidase [Capsulimonadaceae bacterium]|nr:N-acetylmuramoyl-L-alanine amidase [Capsulimonadaceae bacterium]
MPPYLDQDGQVFAPVDFVRLLGADYTLNPGGHSLSITSADGRKFDQQCRVADQRFMIPVESVASQLGAVASWDAHSRTMTLRARILMVREDRDTLTVVTSYPVYYRVDSLDSPARLFVDVYGAELPTGPAAVPAHGDNLLRIRSGQLDPNTTRLVLDLRHPIHYQVAAAIQTNTIQVALNTDRTSTAYVPSTLVGATNNIPRSEQDQSGNDADDNTQPSQSQSAEGAGGSFRITNIEFKNDAGASQVVITTQGAPPGGPSSYRAFLLQDPMRLAVDLPGASIALAGDLASDSDSKLSVTSPDITAIRWGAIPAENGALGRIVLDLSHTVAYNVSTQSTDTGNEYIISINPPTPPVSLPTAGGSLSGKIICIDPGHGGKDGGAPGIGGVWEKQFTLLIAKELRGVLTAEGAKVVMTRADDTFIPLTQRALIGINAHADYFVSIHCDSGSSGRNSQEGTTVYYHGNNATCRNFARSISARLTQTNDGIHSDGIRTDFIRFPGIGFAVLRHSTEPAVLVECGYVNSDHDIGLLANADVRHKIAVSIAAGLQDFSDYKVAER